MLDKGFENDIRNIISHTRPLSERQTMMCKFGSLLNYFTIFSHGLQSAQHGLRQFED
jgi:hypothetical protein